MTETMATIQVPGSIYTRFEKLAHKSKRSVEDEIIEVLAAAVSELDEIQAMADSMVVLNDEELWRAARMKFEDSQVERLAYLRDMKQQQGLSENDAAELAGLLRQYERVILIRAQAAGTLHQRGHDVSVLIGS